MPLPKLDLAPEAPGYSTKFGESVLRTPVRGGRSRFRRDMIGAPAIIEVVWRLDLPEYQLLLAFHDATIAGGTLPFLIDLFVAAAVPTEHEAQWVSAPPQITSVTGTSVLVRAILEVRPADRDTASDAALVASYHDGTPGLPKLALLPSQDAYSETKGETALRVRMNAGPSRSRRDVKRNAAEVGLQWRVGPAFYRYLQAFYWTATAEGALPFRIDLLLKGGDPVSHVAYFVPGTFSLAAVEGLKRTVRAQIEALPIAGA
jgi:hypothetical protein